MKTINDLVNSLSDEEKEFHKDLIKECVDREKDIDKLCKTKVNVEESFIKFLNELEKLNKVIQEVKNLKFEKMTIKSYLERLPKENCYNA